jgi:biopolymer transport protein ExbD
LPRQSLPKGWAVKLARPDADRQLISLVPMIDVLLILLVFFMVTSTYLNLDMIPFVDRSDDPAPSAAATTGEPTTLMVRIAADGRTYVRGEALDGAALQATVAERLAENPLLSVVLLPSTAARTQDLVTAMDLLTTAGATRLRLIQLEARE